MSQIRTSNDLQDWLDKDIAWRIKEISNIRLSLRMDGGAGKVSKTMVRAGIALLYAHWEGFIKNASESYLEFLSNQNLTYANLKPCLVVFGLKKELSFLVNSNKQGKNAKVVEFLINELGKIADLSYRGSINTQSNLNSEVFESIATSIGVETAPYQTKYKLIDESLLKRRNHIAHGEFLDVGAREFDDLSNEVLVLMNRFKTDIENSVSLKLYQV